MGPNWRLQSVYVSTIITLADAHATWALVCCQGVTLRWQSRTPPVLRIRNGYVWEVCTVYTGAPQAAAAPPPRPLRRRHCAAAAATAPLPPPLRRCRRHCVAAAATARRHCGAATATAPPPPHTPCACSDAGGHVHAGVAARRTRARAAPQRNATEVVWWLTRGASSGSVLSFLVNALRHYVTQMYMRGWLRVAPAATAARSPAASAPPPEALSPGSPLQTAATAPPPQPLAYASSGVE
jgi:hypothetical protein